jgi:hypothetical protein
MRRGFVGNDVGGPEFLEDFRGPNTVALAFSNRHLIHTSYVEDAKK